MVWTKEDIIKSIVRKSKHEPQFDLGSVLFDEIHTRVEAGEEVRVDEIAARLAQGYKDLLSKHPDLYAERYANLPITYNPGNSIPADELKSTNVAGIIDGVDFLLNARNETLDRIGPADISIYVRDHNCPYDNGNFNSHILVTQLNSMRQFYRCPKPQEDKKFKHCGAIGRTGYFLKLK